MSRLKQLGFRWNKKSKSTPKELRGFGGEQFKNYNPDHARPIVAKMPIHIVLRSSLATGAMSMKRFERKIQNIIYSKAKQNGIKIYHYANVGNHLHIVCVLANKRKWQAFIVPVTALIARIASGAKKGQKLTKKFWDARPWTRITKWGRPYDALKRYLRINQLQALGFIRETAETIVRENLEAIKIQI